MGELRDRLAPHFEAAKGWGELDELLRQEGVTLYAKGPGVILTNGERYAKLSEMGKRARKSGLEERFGETFDTYAEVRQKKRQQHRSYWDMAKGLRDQVARMGKTLREWVFGGQESLLDRLNRQGKSRQKRGFRRREDRDSPER